MPNLYPATTAALLAMPDLVGIINAHMIDVAPEVGEHVDWAALDVLPASEWVEVLGQTVEEFAAASPHMIVLEVAS